jgi:hypothetical protein
MSINNYALNLRKKLIEAHEPVVPEAFDGVTKDKVRLVLAQIDRASDNMVDAVFAMLDNRPSWFPKAPKGASFCDGATVAHIGAHIGILQRGRETKLDREGRDYWLKPLWEIGAVMKCYLDTNFGIFLDYVHKTKSPNNCYKLDPTFRSLFNWPPPYLEKQVYLWMTKDSLRKRLAEQARIRDILEQQLENKHKDLINLSADFYAKKFLEGFKVVYVDDSDGERIPEHYAKKLKEAGLEITLDDSMPDVLLHNPETEELWVIEAVTSDGEVDIHKQQSMIDFSLRHDKKGIGFTTSYPDWKTAAQRQAKMKNLASDSYLWIAEDPTRQFHIETY